VQTGTLKPKHTTTISLQKANKTHPGVIACEFEDVLGFDVLLFSVGPLLILFGVVLLADGAGGGIIVLFT
jgi:hypothetical protein